MRDDPRQNSQVALTEHQPRIATSLYGGQPNAATQDPEHHRDARNLRQRSTVQRFGFYFPDNYRILFTDLTKSAKIRRNK